jgi:hypothetical protein
MAEDKTKALLEQILAQLYENQSLATANRGDSYLQGGDDQFLGNITTNKFDTNSILNQYGSYGSRYSNTSIFNPYSPYGSRYGALSVNNPYCTNPPGKASFIEAGNGTFLGKINPNKSDQNSIFNKSGPYGSKFSQESIFNKFSTYGNQFNPLSPFNKFSNNPPKIFVRGKFFAYLTKNNLKSPRIDPDELLEWAKNNIPRR